MAELPPGAPRAADEGRRPRSARSATSCARSSARSSSRASAHAADRDLRRRARRSQVGGKAVRAATRSGRRTPQGDVMVHVPGDRAVFTGDILFIDGTPIIWAGPVSNWIARLRPHPGDGRRDHRAGPRADHRPRGVRARARLPRVRRARGARALRRRPADVRRRAGHRARRLRRAGATPSASPSTSTRSTASSRAPRGRPTSMRCSRRWPRSTRRVGGVSWGFLICEVSRRRTEGDGSRNEHPPSANCSRVSDLENTRRRPYVF